MRKQEDSDSEKRLLLAVVLSMAVLFMTPYIFRIFNPAPPVETPSVTESAETSTMPPQADEDGLEGIPVVETEPVIDSQDLELTEAVPETYILENEDLILEFNNVGAGLESVRLKDYSDGGGEPLELIPQGVELETGLVLGLLLDDLERSRTLIESAYEMSIQRQAEGSEILFKFADNQFQVEKSLLIPDHGYEIRIRASVRERGVPVPFRVNLGAGIGPVELYGTGDFLNPTAA